MDRSYIDSRSEWAGKPIIQGNLFFCDGFEKKDWRWPMLLNANWLTEILDHWVLSCPHTAASELLWLSLSAG